MEKIRLLRITTVPISFQFLLGGQLHFMRQQGIEVLAVSATGPEAGSLLQQKIPHRVIPFTRTITPLRDLLCLWKLIRLIHTFKPDIVHTHTPKAGLLGMMAAWLCRVPVRLHTVAGLPWMEASSVKRWLLKLTERITYACATMIYPNSTGLLSFITNEFKIQNSYLTGRQAKFKIIGNGSSNGIDLNYFFRNAELEEKAFEIRKRYSIDERDFVFCFVGRMVRDKGLIELIQAFEKIHEEHKYAWLLLIGHFEEDLDPLPVEIMQKIREGQGIIHAGFQSDIRPWVVAGDTLVLPSYREGFPNVLLQAGTLEKPCIATNINGCNEIIQEGKTGWMVPRKDVDSLAGAMRSVINNREWGKQAGREARQFIAQHFEQEYIWNEILKEYHNQLNRVSKTR